MKSAVRKDVDGDWGKAGTGAEIAIAAVNFALGGEAVIHRSCGREIQAVQDVVTRRSPEFTGRLMIDDGIVALDAVSDFSVDPDDLATELISGILAHPKAPV